MADILNIKDFLNLSEKVPVIDVRSPSEFSQGHIPGAHNIALLDDEERAEIGTLYKKKGQRAAIMRGLDLAGPKLRWYVESVLALNPEGEALIHCWRGGLRSRSFAQFCEIGGLTCHLLDGGYKSYRHMIRDSFLHPQKLLVLGGMTGSGKTEILHRLKDMGEQVIDLEGYASHKGSAFGSIGQEAQPTTEQFENNTASEWLTFDLSRRIWVEDESLRIGKVVINENLFNNMRNAPLIAIDMPQEVRAIRLEKEYCIVEPEVLVETVHKITRRLGGDRTKETIEAFEAREYQRAISILLDYYDKGYQYGMSKRDEDKVFPIKIDENKPSETAAKLREKAVSMGY